MFVGLIVASTWVYIRDAFRESVTSPLRAQVVWR